MKKHETSNPSHLTAIPMLSNETVYIGVDIGKQKHVAGFLSRTLLQRHERFEACPALVFENSRDGFRCLVDRMRFYTSLEACCVLIEHTGHYHCALEHYLQELDITVYTIHVQKRQVGMLKTDKRDALSLANTLFSQLELGVQVADKLHLVRRALPPTEAAIQLRGLIRHRYELIQESTQRKNKLTAICDEIFPELTLILKNPNLPTALVLREKFPTPQAIATASLRALQELRLRNSPSETQLVELQRLAAQSIGVKEIHRQRSLVLEQELLIKELRLIQEHLEQLEAEICQIVEHSREGQILTSIPGIGSIPAATLIASIGNVANFSRASDLKSYLGWAPILTTVYTRAGIELTDPQEGCKLKDIKLTSSGEQPCLGVRP